MMAFKRKGTPTKVDLMGGLKCEECGSTDSKDWKIFNHKIVCSSCYMIDSNLKKKGK